MTAVFMAVLNETVHHAPVDECFGKYYYDNVVPSST